MSQFIYFPFILLPFLCMIFYQYLSARRIRINNQILFSFCDLRRELMSLAREDKISVDSSSFKYLYSFLSKMIHYVRDYKFMSDLFLDVLSKEKLGTEKPEMRTTIEADTKSQGEAMVLVMDKFDKTMGDSFLLADFLFIFKFKSALQGNKRKQYQEQKEEFKLYFSEYGKRYQSDLTPGFTA